MDYNDWYLTITSIYFAFLYRDIDKDRFMNFPPRIIEVLLLYRVDEDMTMLLKAIYGLVRVERQRFKNFSKIMLQIIRFKKTNINYFLVFWVNKCRTNNDINVNL